MDYGSLSDQKLWARVVDGDNKAFEFIYRAHSKKLYVYGHRFTKDTSIIDDAIQEVFISIWSSRNRIVISRSLSHYIFSSYRRLIIKKINEEQFCESIDDPNNMLDFHHYMQGVLEETNISDFEGGKTISALEKLPSRQKEAIYLRYIEELSYESISDIMGVQIPYIYNLIFKGLKTLKENIKISRFAKILAFWVLSIFH